MTKQVFFVTPGKLDLRAITTFGLTAKPETKTPIGRFGTGLKYGVAVLLRLGCNIEIQVGTQKWTFGHATTKFRDKEVESIYLYRHRKVLGPKTISLPFTMSLGAHWDLWMAFRELFANTIDENGWSYDMLEAFTGLNLTGCTTITVTGDAFHKIYENRWKFFIDPNAKPIYASDEIDIYAEQSKGLFYRGVKVYDADKPFMYKYNIKREISLTEDRTASKFEVDWAIAHTIPQAEGMPEHIIRNIVAPSRENAEDDFNYEYVGTPTKQFLDIAQKGMEADVVPSAVSAMVNKYRPATRHYVPVELDWREELILAIDRGDFDEVTRIINEDRKAVTSLIQDAIDREKAQNRAPEVVMVPKDKPLGALVNPTKPANLDDEIPF